MNARGMPVLVRNVVASLLLAGAGLAVAADQPPGPPAAPSKAQREQMALLHEKMAACLRSDKDVATCHDEMRNNCRTMMGEQGCPMMGGGMHEMMQSAPPPKPENK